MRFGANISLFFVLITALVTGLFYFSYKFSWIRIPDVSKIQDVYRMMECKMTWEEEKRQINTEFIYPAGVACSQPSTGSSRQDIATTTKWLAPIVWEGTFDLTVINNIYKLKNITVAITFLALGKYVRFVKDFLESAEQHFMVGYQVHYYLFTDVPDDVPIVMLATGRQLIIKKTESSKRWQEIVLHRMELTEKLIEKELINTADYIFCVDVDSKFYGHWGAESLGDLVGLLHSWLFGLTRDQLTYERRPESQAYIPIEEGDYYYSAAIFGGRLNSVYRLVKTCRIQADMDRANQIEAVWQEESHLNKYFLYNKPTKLLSPEYIWDDRRVEKPDYIKVVRFSQVIKNYAEVRPNP